MSEEHPRWDLLPHDPERFFGLKAGFQRADLKRSYNKLLRKFKPEKAPAEFQRIRAAFEQLDTRLRYGVETQPVESSVFSSQTGSTSGKTKDASATLSSLRDALEASDPKTVYAKLKSLPKKSPRDYFALAILSDLCEPKQQQMFLKWLLTGLKEYPREQAIYRLLQNYFQSEMSPKLAIQVLPMLAGVLKNDTFFVLTESLWMDLLAQVPFPTFQKLLQKCDVQLKSHMIRGKTVFCLQLLRAAAFRAPMKWLRAIAKFVEDNHDQVPDYLEFDFEITMAILKYREQAKAFSAAHPIRFAIHSAITDYCNLDENAGSQSVMECHSRLSSGANQLMEAFPMHEDNDWSDTIEAWHWVSVDVARRLWMEPDEPDFQQLVNIVAENVLHAENSQGSTFFMRINLGKIGSHALILVMILLLIPWILAGFLPDNPVVKTILFALRLVGLIGYGLAFKRISAWSEQRTSQTLLNSYEDRWRPIMTRMLSGTNGNFQAVCGVLNYLIEESEYQTNVAPYLLAYVARDYGLQLFSHSQMFIK